MLLCRLRQLLAARDIRILCKEGGSWRVEGESSLLGGDGGSTSGVASAS